jgi:hypothetical protein
MIQGVGTNNEMAYALGDCPHIRKTKGQEVCSPSEPLTNTEHGESDKDPTLDEDSGKCNPIRYSA